MSSGRAFTNKESLRAGVPDPRISLPALSRECRASMTVEAALVLPLFLYFFCNILFLLDIIRLQSVMLAAVRETGTKICEYAYFLDKGEALLTDAGIDLSGIPDGIASLLLSETYVRSEVGAYLGEEYLEESPLRGDSISYLESGLMNGNDLVQIVADYCVQPFVPFIAPDTFVMQTRFVGHAWTGYDLSGENGSGREEDADDPIVYITPAGEVYHTSADCTYLRPHVRQTTASEIADKRANDGSCYYACESCRPTKRGTLYYTTDGNRYHSSAACSKIQHDIVEAHRSEVEGARRPCSKCAGG